MKTHILKCWPKYFDQIKAGRKTFEYRVNDRDFQEGDTVILKRQTRDAREAPIDITAKPLQFTIGYMLTLTADAPRWAVFSLLPLAEDGK